MPPLDYVRFALTALLGHRLRSVLSLLGVAVGVAAVIMLTSLGEGARLYVTQEFASLGTNLVIVLPGRVETTGMMPLFGNSQSDLTLADATAIVRRVPQVRRVAPLAVGSATARSGERSREVTVLGATADMLAVRRLSMRIGEYLPGGDPEQAPRVCVLGAGLQRELFPGRSPLGQILRLGEERYRVIGVVAPRGTSMGMNLDDAVHVPVSLTMKMLDTTSLFRILIEVASRDDMSAVRDRALAVLTERHDGREDVTILTQDAVLGSFNKILSILTIALGAIGAISLGVAGVGIMNVMLVSVSERTSEVGLLKALGATSGQILAAFLVEAAILSFVGGLLGLAAGFAAGRALGELYPSFPVSAPMWAVWGALAVSATVGLAFGVLPARRAARLEPIAALARR